MYWILGVVASLVAIVAGYYYLWKPIGWKKKPATDSNDQTPKDVQPQAGTQTQAQQTQGQTPTPAPVVPLNPSNPNPKAQTGTGDVWADVFQPSRKIQLKLLSFRSAKLAQIATNEVLKKAGYSTKMIKVDGAFGKNSKEAAAAVLGIVFTPGPSYDFQKYAATSGTYALGTYLSNCCKYLSGQSCDDNGLKASINNLSDVQKTLILKKDK